MGLEPTTLWTTTRCSNQLSYTRHNLILRRKPQAKTRGFQCRDRFLYPRPDSVKKTTGRADLIHRPMAQAHSLGMMIKSCACAPAKDQKKVTNPELKPHPFVGIEIEYKV